MKKLSKILSCLLISTYCVAAVSPKNIPVKELDANNFSSGLDSYHDSAVIPETYVQDALNVYFDKQAPVEKRQGYTTVFSSKTYAYTNAWSYTDSNNTSWIIVRASDSIIASNLIGTVVLISTISVNNNVDEVNAFGNAYFTDQTSGVYYWNGTATTYISGSPKGSLIAQFHNRVWVAGQAVPNGNLLNCSKFLDGTTWTTGLNPTDPAQFTIGLQDNFDNITALYPFLDTLYVTKFSSIYALYGFDNTNFQNSILTRECGCIDKNSIQSFNKGLVFASLRGIEFYDGYNCARISDPIKNKVDAAIQQTSFSQNTWVQQSQPDWNAGTISSLASLPSSLALSTFSVTENSSTFWSLGTISNLTYAAGALKINSNIVDLNNNSFESGDTTNWTKVTTSIGFGNVTSDTLCSAITGRDGTHFERINASGINAQLISCDGSTVFGQVLNLGAYASGTCSQWTAINISDGSYTGRCGKLRFYNPNDAPADTLTSDNFILNGFPVTFYVAYYTRVSPATSETFVDYVTGMPKSSVLAGTYTSQIYDTHITSPTYQMQATFTPNTETPYFAILTSSWTGAFTNLMTSTGTNAVGERYTEYTTSISVIPTNNEDANTAINSVSIVAAASTGTFKSQIHNSGSINSWGNFSSVNTLNGGNISYSICASTNSNMSYPLNCANQTNNMQISIATATYVQFFTTFTVTTATQAPSVSEVSIQWFSGAKSNPMASTVYDNRYLLSVTTSPANIVNDSVLVLNTKGAWSIFDIHAGGLIISKNNLYHADSLSTGLVYQDNQGYNDNGVAIKSYIRTKDYSLGSLISDSLYDSFWPTLINNGNYNVKFYYNLDRGTNDYSLATVSQSEFSGTKFTKIPFPFSSSNPNVSQTINFLIRADDLGEPFQFEGFSLLSHERMIQE